MKQADCRMDRAKAIYKQAIQELSEAGLVWLEDRLAIHFAGRPGGGRKAIFNRPEVALGGPPAKKAKNEALSKESPAA